jgi:hypothetical protein
VAVYRGVDLSEVTPERVEFGAVGGRVPYDSQFA